MCSRLSACKTGDMCCFKFAEPAGRHIVESDGRNRAPMARQETHTSADTVGLAPSAAAAALYTWGPHQRSSKERQPSNAVCCCHLHIRVHFCCCVYQLNRLSGPMFSLGATNAHMMLKLSFSFTFSSFLFPGRPAVVMSETQSNSYVPCGV